MAEIRFLADELTTFRCAQRLDPREAAADLGASEAYLERHSGIQAEDLLLIARENFGSIWKPPGDPLPERFGRSRYSDGSYPVLYTALEKEVAKSERCYWFVEGILKNGTGNSGTFYLYACGVKGKYLDHRNGHKTNKEFVADKYDFCQNLGKAAKDRKVDFMMVPSARRLGGICVPVFSEDSSRVETAITSFDVRWDAEEKKVIIACGDKKSYITFDAVYALV